MKFVCNSGWSLSVRLICLLCLFSLVPFARGQSAAVAPPVTQGQQLDALTAGLRTAMQQMEQTRAEMAHMQTEIDRLRAQIGATKTTPSGTGEAVAQAGTPVGGTSDPSSSEAFPVTEEIEAIKASIKQEQQIKVESTSRLPVRVSGLVLVNTFVNHGVVDQIDLPTAALQPGGASGQTSTGAGFRQTILGLEGTGPVLGTAHTSARVSLDFFGGVTGSASSGPAGIVRLRTAAIRADWTHDRLEANYDTPIISPLSPESLATVAQPSQAWSGNLWTWAPQVYWQHVHSLAGERQLNFQVGLLDTQTLNAANTIVRGTGPGEASGQPSYETHLGYASGGADRRLQLGIGGLYGRQVYANQGKVDTWTTTADWQIPLSARFRVSGELYRGRGLGSLGGGAYRDAFSYRLPGSAAPFVRGLDAEGGWLQFTYKASSVVRANASVGQDSASGNELRTAVPAAVTNPLFFYARNRTIVGNIIYQPWSSFLISPEFRRLQSWQIVGSSNKANVYALTFGYQF